MGAEPFHRSGERRIIDAAASGLPDPRAVMRPSDRPSPSRPEGRTPWGVSRICWANVCAPTGVPMVAFPLPTKRWVSLLRTTIPSAQRP
jgi:hypothetical protein